MAYILPPEQEQINLNFEKIVNSCNKEQGWIGKNMFCHTLVGSVRTKNLANFDHPALLFIADLNLFSLVVILMETLMVFYAQATASSVMFWLYYNESLMYGYF